MMFSESDRKNLKIAFSGNFRARLSGAPSQPLEVWRAPRRGESKEHDLVDSVKDGLHRCFSNWGAAPLVVHGATAGGAWMTNMENMERI